MPLIRNCTPSSIRVFIELSTGLTTIRGSCRFCSSVTPLEAACTCSFDSSSTCLSTFRITASPSTTTSPIAVAASCIRISPRETLFPACTSMRSVSYPTYEHSSTQAAASLSKFRTNLPFPSVVVPAACTVSCTARTVAPTNASPSFASRIVPAIFTFPAITANAAPSIEPNIKSLVFITYYSL